MEFEPKEVSIALKECGGGKALAKVAWGFFKEEFCAMLSKFHHRDYLNMEINSTFIALHSQDS